MIRATTGGVMKTYRSNLMNSFITMNKSRNTVLTQRTFNSYAEDPAAAAKAFRLRKSRMTVSSQHSICSDVMKKYETAFSCLQSIDEVLDTQGGVDGTYMKTLKGTTLSMLNDPEGDAREQLSKVLDEMSNMLVQTMNQKYGDNFIFAGADGHNVPFEIKDNKLYYRGIWVDASIPNVLTKTGADGTTNLIAVDADGNILDPDTIQDGDEVYYLYMDNVTTISKEEYDELYTLPDLQKKEGTDEFLRCGYNENGDIVAMDDGDYYMTITVNEEDGTWTPNEPIEISKYEAIQERIKNTNFLSEDDGTGTDTYQLVEVDENGNPKDGGGYYRIVDDSQLITKEDYDQQKLDAEKLKYLADEKFFVDIGLGFQENDHGELIESSGFDAALIGIKFLGYGMDEDGDPRNLYSLVQKMRKVADSVPSGDDWGIETWNEFDRLVSKFETACSGFKTEFVGLAGGTTKLENQVELLEENFYNLQEQYSELEDVDMVDAITSFIWAEYCYNAALKVGNSILSESLMDYLR